MTNISSDKLLDMCCNLEAQVSRLQVLNESLTKNNERILQDNQAMMVQLKSLEKRVEELETYKRVQAEVIRDMIRAMKENT